MTRDIKENEHSKEAEIVRLPTPSRTICIDGMTGQICAPEPIEHGGHASVRLIARNQTLALVSISVSRLLESAQIASQASACAISIS